MKTSMKLAILAFATIAGFAGAAFAESRSVYDPVNLRSGPGVAWPVIKVVPANEQVEILTCGSGSSQPWCQVTYDGDTGWIAAKVLAPSGRSGVKVAPLATRYSVHVYSSPSLNAGVLAVIPPETQVDVTGCRKSWGRDWCHVNYEGASGYIRGSLLKRVNTVMNPQSF